MTETPFISIPCPGDIVQLEVVGEVPKIGPGEKLTWSTAEKRHFIYRQHGECTFDDDGEIVSQEPYQIMAYHEVPGFDAHPYAVAFHAPELGAICILESVVGQGLEQLAQTGFRFEIFGVGSGYEPLHVAWPMFNQEHPLLLRFHNPLDKELPPFTLSFFVSAPKDFAERWVKDE